MRVTDDTIQITVESRDAVIAADTINRLFDAGSITTCNGYTLKPRFVSDVATSWQNGTVSVTVAAREPGHIRDLYYRVGQTMTLR